MCGSGKSLDRLFCDSRDIELNDRLRAVALHHVNISGANTIAPATIAKP